MLVITCNLPFGPDFYPELPYLYVTSPVKSNIWDIGSSQSISWAVQNLPFISSIKMDLYKNDTLQYNIDNNININGQSSNNSQQTADSSLLQIDYDWLLLYTLNEGNNYNVRITAKQNESGIDTFIYAESEEFKLSCSTCPIYFQITSPPPGGEIWGIGSSQEIKWETNSAIMASSASNQIKIDLYKSNIYFSTIADNIENFGLHTWTVANIDGLEQATNYKIRISSISEPEKYGESYDSFALKQGPFIKVTSPNGGETWEQGSSPAITWSSANLTNSYVKIQLYRSSSPSGTYSWSKTLVSSKPKDGSYNWTIPSNLSTSYYYKVRIEEYGNPSVYDESDAYFTISVETSSITVTSPNGGETWEQDSSPAITWSSANLTNSYVKIQLYRSSSPSGTYSWSKTLVSSTNNDGSYTWNISSSLSITKYYKIRIEDYNDSSNYDESDNYFTISEE